MKPKSMDTLGDRFKHLREREGFTQKDVADKLGLTKTSISSFEHNNHSMSLNKFVMLKEVFTQEFSWDWLIGDAEGASKIEVEESTGMYDTSKKDENQQGLLAENYRTQIADLKKENAWLKEIIDRLTKKGD